MSSRRKFIDYWRDAVWAAENLDPHEKLVLFAYGRFADFHTGGNVKPGQTLISRMCGLSRRAVGQVTNRLVEKGWMLCIRKGGMAKKGGTRVTSLYQLCFPTSEAAALLQESTRQIEHTTSASAAHDYRAGFAQSSLPSNTSSPTTSAPTALIGSGEHEPCPVCNGTGEGFSGGWCPACKTRPAVVA